MLTEEDISAAHCQGAHSSAYLRNQGGLGEMHNESSLCPKGHDHKAASVTVGADEATCSFIAINMATADVPHYLTGLTLVVHGILTR